MHCYRVAPRAVGIGVKSNLCWKPLLTSSCRSDVDSVCVRCSQAITNYSRSHGWSQLVLCPHPLTFPSNVWKTCPKVCWSMQLIYCPYKCNTTNIQETPWVADFIFWLTWLFSFHFKSFFFGFCDTFVYGSLIVSRIATSKGNFFIPKRGCFNMTVGKVKTPKINK